MAICFTTAITIIRWMKTQSFPHYLALRFSFHHYSYYLKFMKLIQRALHLTF